MRPPNFLSTSSNRASLSITSSLYDRRALDCTASRPLIQSLQQLTLLTSSVVRVRETLCVDGGVERLIQIMKETSSCADTMACYKWHFAFQCVLNLGARGSENVRRHILEAGAIPLLATVLDNYLVANSNVQEFRWRDHTEKPNELVLFPEGSRQPQAQPQTQTQTQPQPQPRQQEVQVLNDQIGAAAAAADPAAASSSTTVVSATGTGSGTGSNNGSDPAVTAAAAAAAASETAAAAAAAATRTGVAPNVASAAPNGANLGTYFGISAASGSGSGNGSGSGSADSELGIKHSSGGLIIPRDIDVSWALEIIAFVSKYSNLRREMQETYLLPQLSLRPQHELYDEDEDEDDMHMHTHMHMHMPHHTHSHVHVHSLDGEDVDDDEMGDPLGAEYECEFGAGLGSDRDTSLPSPSLGDEMDVEDEEMAAAAPQHAPSCAVRCGCSAAAAAAAAVNIVDLANLRDAELGERLKYNLDLATQIPLDVVEPNPKQLRYYQYNFENDIDFDEEHRAKRINIFELVERFTKFRYPREFSYWSSIIMRNFVRKDEGGIRQCANFACGKWETFPRQFAKCRRCKRTKYCSKACQLSAWSMHRYWCAPTTSSSSQTQSNENENH